MAFTVARPIATQVMVAAFGVERLIGRKRHENSLQIVIERSPVPALGLALVVTFERCGAVNRPHAGLPSDHRRC